MKERVRFAAWAAFWVGTPRAARQVLAAEEIDYLVSDHVAEITMALLRGPARRTRVSAR